MTVDYAKEEIQERHLDFLVLGKRTDLPATLWLPDSFLFVCFKTYPPSNDLKPLACLLSPGFPDLNGYTWLASFVCLRQGFSV